MSDATVVAPPHAPATDAGRRARLTVFLVVFIDLLGFGIVLPQLPLIGRDFLNPLLGDADSAAKGLIIGALYASFSGMQFLFAPAWGRLSDRIGRRPVLLVGLVGSVVFYALFGVGSMVGGLFGLILLFVARTGAGVAGATIAVAQAVIADVTPSHERAKGMALIGAAFGIGFTFGPALGALMLWLAPSFAGGPGFAASLTSLLSLVIGLRQLPETLRPGHRPAEGNRLANLVYVLRVPEIGLLVASYFLATFAFANFETTLAFLNDALGFDRKENALVFAGVGLTLILSAGGLVRRLATRMPEKRMLTVGVGGMALGLAGLATVAHWVVPSSASGRGIFLAAFAANIIVTVVGYSFLNPSIQSLISKRSDAARQGEFLGVNQSAAALARVVGPAVGPLLFALTPTHALPYAIASVLLLIVLGLVARLRHD